YPSRQLDALLPVLLSGIQVVPLVVYTGETKMRFASNPLRRITCQKEGSPVGLGRQVKPVFSFLYLAQTGCSRYGVDRIPKRLTDRNDFGIGPAGRGTVSLELIGISQRPVSGSAERQVVGAQMLQGAARLGNDGFSIVLNDSQRGPHGGNTSDKVLGPVVWFGALQCGFSSL